MKKKEETTVVQPLEPEFLKQYRACYPKAKKFHVTGDNLVFPDNLKAAEAHQSRLGKGELKTY